MKNGFTIYETIISLAVIVMISLLCATACLFTNKSILKSKSLNVGLVEIENISKIYKDTNIENLGEFSVEPLKSNIENFYNVEINFMENFEENENNCVLMFELFFDNSFKITDNANTKVWIAFFKNNNYLKMCGKIFYGNSIIFENENVFEKAVQVWKIAN